MVLFGAPTGHEDDPARAIEAAIELRAALPQINREAAALVREWISAHPQQRSLLQVIRGGIRQSIGIASGPVFAGLLGTPERHGYTVIGRTVGLAAKLLATAGPDDVLLAAATYRGVRHLVDVDALPPLVLEGHHTPVPIYRVVRKHNSTSPRSDVRRHSAPLAGRAAELAQLLNLAQHALQPGSDAGQVVALVGEAGIGKSRLAKEALERIAASTPSAGLMRATCQSYEQFTPYTPIARLLRQALGIMPASDPEVEAQKVQQQLTHRVPTWSRFAPLLRALLHLPLAETELTQALTSEQRRDRLHDLVVAILLAIPPSQSRVLVVDDLHWADASSLAIIDRVSIELAGHPLLLLLVYRPSPAQLEPWYNMEHGSVVRLGELARSESEALVRSLLDGAPPVELWPLIDHTQSTPFFLEETVHYLLETGMLRRNPEGSWVYARPTGDLAIPTQIEQLLIGRIDRLPEAMRMLLEVAAVIGPQFSARLLGTVVTQYGIPGGHLGELIDAGLIVPHESAAEGLYQFRHALVHDVVYSTMLFARRRERHHQVAAAIEQVYADQLDDWHGLLAHHYLRAEQFDRAFPHFLAAAQEARARFANNEALAFYEQALATAPWREQSDGPRDSEQAAQLHEHIGDLLVARVLDKDGAGSYGDVIAAIEWVINNRASYNVRVLNLSLYAPVTGPYWADPLGQAVMRAWRAGITVVAAAGNAGSEAATITVPGNVPYVITVGALKSGRYTQSGNDELAYYSSRGPTESAFIKPDVLVPASRTIAPMPDDSTLAVELSEECARRAAAGSSQPCIETRADVDYGIGHPAKQHTYFYLSGTSMAAAEVSGIIALILQANPDLTNNQVKQRLLSTAPAAIDLTSNQPVYSPWEQGAGLIHTQQAVFTTTVGLANVGMDINLDLTTDTHYWGYTTWNDPPGEFRLIDPTTGQPLAVWDGASRTWAGGSRTWAGGSRAWAGGSRTWAGGTTSWTGSSSFWAGGSRAWAGSIPQTSLSTASQSEVLVRDSEYRALLPFVLR